MSVSLSPTQAGAPVSRISSRKRCRGDAAESDNDGPRAAECATRVRPVSNWSSNSATSTVSIGTNTCAAINLLMAINQNVPACVAAGTNNGCRPDPNYGNNSQYSSAGDSNYHGLHLSFVQRPARWGHYRVCYTLSKSMNNVGEFFFSCPIDPTDLAKDWGRSDDDQRHRLVVNGDDQFPDGARARQPGNDRSRISAGQLRSGLLGVAVQHHVRCYHGTRNDRSADR